MYFTYKGCPYITEHIMEVVDELLPVMAKHYSHFADKTIRVTVKDRVKYYVGMSSFNVYAPDQAEIFVSKYWYKIFLEANDVGRQHLRNNLVHEIAHCIDYFTRGGSKHDKFWKNIGKDFGEILKARRHIEGTILEIHNERK